MITKSGLQGPKGAGESEFARPRALEETRGRVGLALVFRTVKEGKRVRIESGDSSSMTLLSTDPFALRKQMIVADGPQ
jgi:hypothetical protein